MIRRFVGDMTIKSENGWGVRHHVNAFDITGSFSRAIISLGGNDGRVPIEKYSIEVEKLLSKVRGLGVEKITWVGPIPAVREEGDVKQRHEVARSHLISILKKHCDVDFIDSFDVPLRPDDYRDGVHLGSNYSKWVFAIKKQLQESMTSASACLSQRSGGIPPVVGLIGLGLLAFTAYRYARK